MERKRQQNNSLVRGSGWGAHVQFEGFLRLLHHLLTQHPAADQLLDGHDLRPKWRSCQPVQHCNKRDDRMHVKCATHSRLWVFKTCDGLRVSHDARGAGFSTATGGGAAAGVSGMAAVTWVETAVSTGSSPADLTCCRRAEFSLTIAIFSLTIAAFCARSSLHSRCIFASATRPGPWTKSSFVSVRKTAEQHARSATPARSARQAAQCRGRARCCKLTGPAAAAEAIGCLALAISSPSSESPSSDESGLVKPMLGSAVDV